jgi:hypothetical protein
LKSDDPADDPVGSPSGARRPYAAPEVSWEEAIEIQANLTSACDKIGGTGGLCNTNPAS